MPTQHLLSLYVQDDGSLDPRFRISLLQNGKRMSITHGMKQQFTNMIVKERLSANKLMPVI